MRDGPDIALTAAVIGDAARAHMLSVLMAGEARTAGELAREAGVTPQTASFHIARMRDAGLVRTHRQGRHSYVVLADSDVAAALEALMVVSQTRSRPGPRDPALRAARVCYDHLAGDAGVALRDNLLAAGLIDDGANGCRLRSGAAARLGLDEADAAIAGAPCLDWSVRRFHIGGALGRRLLSHVFSKGWVARGIGRELRFPIGGLARLERWAAG